MHYYLEKLQFLEVTNTCMACCWLYALEYFLAFDFVSTVQRAMFGTYSDNFKKIIVLCFDSFVCFPVILAIIEECNYAWNSTKQTPV